jgi:hypothetical protein
MGCISTKTPVASNLRPRIVARTDGILYVQAAFSAMRPAALSKRNFRYIEGWLDVRSADVGHEPLLAHEGIPGRLDNRAPQGVSLAGIFWTFTQGIPGSIPGRPTK